MEMLVLLGVRLSLTHTEDGELTEVELSPVRIPQRLIAQLHTLLVGLLRVSQQADFAEELLFNFHTQLVYHTLFLSLLIHTELQLVERLMLTLLKLLRRTSIFALDVSSGILISSVLFFEKPLLTVTSEGMILISPGKKLRKFLLLKFVRSIFKITQDSFTRKSLWYISQTIM